MTFALPDFRGRVPIHAGQGPGLSPYTIGQMGGNETVTLLTNQIPAHGHPARCSGNDANLGLAEGNFLATTATNTYASTGGSLLNDTTIGSVGGSQPHLNLQPYTCVNFIIALEGIFPSRN